MALINCPECGQKISDKASACIHCGCPIEKNKTCPECGSFVNESDTVCKTCGFPFETQVITTENTEIKIADTNQDNNLLTEKTAVELINYIQFSVAKIINGKSKGLLEDEFNSVINNINPTSLQDPELINAYDLLLSTLTELKLNENQREHTIKVLERKKKNAVTNCLNSFGSIFVPGANPATLLASIAYTGVSAALNYRRAVNEVEIEGEEEFFEINQNDIEYIDSLRADLFIATAKVFANKNNSVEGLISENTMKQFAEVVNNLYDSEENATKALAFLDAAEHDLSSFPPYWLARAIANWKSPDSKGEFFDYFSNFSQLAKNNPIFKKNPYLLEAAKLRIEIENESLRVFSGAVDEEERKEKSISYIKKSINYIKENTQSTQLDLDNMNFDLVQLYEQIGDFENAEKSIEYLENRQLIPKSSRLKLQCNLLQNKLSDYETVELMEKAFCAVEFDLSKYYWIFDRRNQNDMYIAIGTPNVKFHISENVIDELDINSVRFSPDGKTNFTVADLVTHNSSLDTDDTYGCVYECKNFTWNDLAQNPFVEIDFGSFTSYYKVSIYEPENWEYFEKIEYLGSLERITTNIDLLDSEDIVSEFTTANAKDIASKIGGGAILGGLIGLGIGTATAAKDIKKAWDSRGKQKLTWLTISLIGVRKNSGYRIDLIDENGEILIPDLRD